MSDATLTTHPPLPDLAAIAESQIGTEEDAAHTNRGAAVQRYQDMTDLSGTGWPWCAAFVDWSVARWLEACRPLRADRGDGFSRPRTAAAFGLIEWARGQAHNGVQVMDPASGLAPRRGDLVVYRFSHCGIVTAPVTASNFQAVEGNTNDDGSRDGHEVCRRTRAISLVRAFIRLPAPAPLAVKGGQA